MWKHKTAIILALVAIFSFLVAPGAAYADEGAGGMEMEVNGYRVRLVFPTSAKIGENDFHVQITDPDGSPVSGAQVRAAVQPVEKTETHEVDMGNAHGHNPAPPTSAHDDMGGMDMGGHDEQPTVAPADSMDGMSDMDGDAAPESTDSHGAAEMDDHAAQSLSVALQAGHEAGEYSGTITFPQAGHWMLTVDFTVDGETLQAEFPLEVASDFPASYGILAGFFGLNVAIVAVAAVTKRKAIRA